MTFSQKVMHKRNSKFWVVFGLIFMAIVAVIMSMAN